MLDAPEVVAKPLRAAKFRVMAEESEAEQVEDTDINNEADEAHRPKFEEVVNEALERCAQGAPEAQEGRNHVLECRAFFQRFPPRAVVAVPLNDLRETLLEGNLWFVPQFGPNFGDIDAVPEIMA